MPTEVLIESANKSRDLLIPAAGNALRRSEPPRSKAAKDEYGRCCIPLVAAQTSPHQREQNEKAEDVPIRK